MNTQTGQHSRDLPQEVDQDISDGELAGLATQPNSRNAVLGLGTSTNVPGITDHIPGGQAGFGVPIRSGTPEPWKKVLADDGLSYCYVNTVDGSVSWTLPTLDATAPQGDSGVYVQLEDSILSLSTSTSDHETTMVNPSSESSFTRRLRSDSAVSQPTDRSRSTDRYSVHSDDSDIQPPPRERSESAASLKRNGNTTGMPSGLKMKPRPPQRVPELTSSEQSAQSLQRVLAPPPPDSVNDLSAITREAIASVVQYLQSQDVRSQPRYGQELNERVLAIVYSVRNLLYVCASPSGHIPSNLYTRDARHPRPTPASQTMQAHLKPAQRKVAGTLSKLVLSTLAIQYDTGMSSNDKSLRMEADASELERAIIAFVLEVQRFLNQNPYWSNQNSIKRLHGVFSVQNIGMGLPGAGAAACWKGFGWLALDEMVDSPNRLLSIEVVSELKSHVLHIEVKRVQFSEPSNDAPKSSGI
jgi:son of sevenless